MADLRVNFTDRDNPVVFYGIAGLGPGLLEREASSYAPAEEEWMAFNRVGLGIEVHLFERLSLSLEEGYVYGFAGVPFNLFGSGANGLGLGSPNYPPVSVGIDFERF